MSLQEKVIKGKVGLLELAKRVRNVLEACRVMGSFRKALLADIRGQRAAREGEGVGGVSHQEE